MLVSSHLEEQALQSDKCQGSWLVAWKYDCRNRNEQVKQLENSTYLMLLLRSAWCVAWLIGAHPLVTFSKWTLELCLPWLHVWTVFVWVAL